VRRRAFISLLGGAAVAWLLAAAGAADAQTVALRQLGTTGPTPVAIVEVTNQTPAAMQYALVECVLFDANHVAIDVRRAAIENIGAAASAVGEVRFLSPNPMTGLSTVCRVADSVRADQAAAAAGPITVDVHHLRIRNTAVMAVFKVKNGSDKRIDKVPTICTLFDAGKPIDATATAARYVDPGESAEGLAIFHRPTTSLADIDASCRIGSE